MQLLNCCCMLVQKRLTAVQAPLQPGQESHRKQRRHITQHKFPILQVLALLIFQSLRLAIPKILCSIPLLDLFCPTAFQQRFQSLFLHTDKFLRKFCQKSNCLTHILLHGAGNDTTGGGQKSHTTSGRHRNCVPNKTKTSNPYIYIYVWCVCVSVNIYIYIYIWYRIDSLPKYGAINVQSSCSTTYSSPKKKCMLWILITGNENKLQLTLDLAVIVSHITKEPKMIVNTNFFSLPQPLEILQSEHPS